LSDGARITKTIIRVCVKVSSKSNYSISFTNKMCLLKTISSSEPSFFSILEADYTKLGN